MSLTIGIGSQVEVTLVGGGLERGEVVTYRMIGGRYDVTIKTLSGAIVTGVVLPRSDGSLTDLLDADTIARAVLRGHELRMPVQRQLQALATAVLARRGAA